MLGKSSIPRITANTSVVSILVLKNSLKRKILSNYIPCIFVRVEEL